MNIHKGDYKMVERIKNKKGFTIIEIMVVIALIGILAAVLVPKFTGIKETAKNAGMLTNAKMVEAYVASQIDGYAVADADDLEDAIEAQFGDGNNPLANPYTAVEDGDNINVSVVDVGDYASSGTSGTVYVVIDEDTLETYINGFDNNASELKATQRKLTK